jgi:ABC-type dipeptide/oligopeptide/nickel transport system permease subunit
VKSGRNVPLTVGAILCALGLAAAVFGPLVAPRDPLEFNYVAFSGDTPISPPFPPFTAAEFPLGSDAFGRDILSQLLWAVRPTLALAGLVAAVRLSLGALAGLVAGWRTDGPGRLANGAISAALSLPTLLVSLAAIAALGGRLGAGAFIIGLCLTGWAETARLFREETRIVRTQIYVEAARASGLSEWQIALRHGLRQLTPLAWQTFTFEISGTLLAIAALGFLGYYVGGVNWIMVGDFTARRISGWPRSAARCISSSPGCR